MRAVYGYLLIQVIDPTKLNGFYALWGRHAEWFEQMGQNLTQTQ
jgi:hypothetical protein